MPELPEVETITRDLATTIVGARVANIWGSGLGLHLARTVDLAGLRGVASMRSVVEVRRKAKYILIEFERARDRQGPLRPGVLIHLGMSGRLLVEPVSKPRPAHTHIAFTFTDGRELRFRDPRRFGWVASGAPVDARPELATLGPDPLSELDVVDLAARLAGVRAPIKAFLLDQTPDWRPREYLCLRGAAPRPDSPGDPGGPGARPRGRVAGGDPRGARARYQESRYDLARLRRFVWRGRQQRRRPARLWSRGTAVSDLRRAHSTADRRGAINVFLRALPATLTPTSRLSVFARIPVSRRLAVLPRRGRATANCCGPRVVARRNGRDTRW